MSTFHDWFRRRAVQSGWLRVVDFEDALAAWEGFIDQCREGYSFCIDEYDNDLSVRNLLQIAFSAEADDLPGSEDARRRVGVLDDRFRRLVRTDVSVRGSAAHWWSRAVPSYGGAELVDDLMGVYGVHIALVPGR